MDDSALSLFAPYSSRTNGAFIEADLFSLLQHSPFVVRSFEFSLADGAIDCTRSYALGDNFARRYRQVNSSAQTDPSHLVLFDVKSSSGLAAGDQWFQSGHAQRERVAFYLCVCSANPNYVDLIPNLEQTPAALDRAIEQGRGADAERYNINVTRRLRVSSSAYEGLDPCSTPYRMPIRLLPEAIARVRRCVRHNETYHNPWNNVPFPGWEPAGCSHPDWIRPDEGTAHFTAYQHAIPDITFDFTLLQPRLSDFKINGYNIQHKVDTQPRRQDDDFASVLVSRDSTKGARHYYFNATERFDFLFYSFEHRGIPCTQSFFFVPERHIPDDFYTSTSKRSSFTCLMDWHFSIDLEGRWVAKVLEIIEAEPRPRRGGHRPARPSDYTPTRSILPSGAKVEDDGQSAASPSLAGEEESALAVAHSRTLYETAMERAQCRFFHAIMSVCARKRAGVLVVLPRHCGLGDFGYTRYRWSGAEQAAYQQRQRPPHFLHSLPPSAPVVPITYYAQHRETSYRGAVVTSAQFRRINYSSGRRLLLWDCGGPDVNGAAILPAIIPSDDISPTDGQRRIFFESLREDPYAFAKKMPNVSSLLSTGYLAAEYAPVGGGPLSYATHCHWSSVWDVLNSFSMDAEFEHPQGCVRQPHLYRYSVGAIAQDILRQEMASRQA